MHLLSRRTLLWLIPAALLLWGGVHVVSAWLEDPRELILGNWAEEGRHGGNAEVTNAVIRWQLGGHRGSTPYEWVQTDKEPYTLQLTYRHETVLVDITFDGNDTAIADPRVWDKLPADAQQWVKERNKALNRPAQEIRFRFRRGKE